MYTDTKTESWYAIFVETGQEDRVKERLHYRFEDSIRFVVPKRKLRERKNGIWLNNIRTLFPGYVLANGKINVEGYYQLKGVPGLFGLLRSQCDALRIADQEMDVISRLIGNDEIIGTSSVFVENGKVVVVDGPLVSLEGTIISIDKRKGRAKVKLNFIGEERTIDFAIEVLGVVG